MPSLRKLVENVEYNKLPSPMKPDFASVYKSEKDSAIEKLPDTDTNDGVVKSTTRQNDTNHCKVNPANQNQTGKKTNDGTSNKLVREDDVIELLSDEEDISLDQLAKLKQNGTCTNAISNLTAKISTIADNGTAKVKGAGDKSDSRNGNLAVSTTKNAQALAANKKRPAIANGLMNGTAAAAAAATKPSGATTQPVQLTAANNNNSIPAPQVQYPYSANPTVQQNVNAILQNIRTNLQQTMPQPTLQPFAYGPAAVTAGLGLERWSEHRIDAASTIDDLEAIRNRLITLAKRADLRLKEMNFRKAIGMIESKDDGEQEMDVIRKLVERAESSLTVDSKNEENDRKRTQLEDTSIDPYNNDNSEKRQRSSCCPFCLSNTTPRDTDEMNMCSICEEQSNMCLQCRGYCIKCHRLACEDCLMRCDTCLSDTYCSDCMPKSGKCAKCSFGMNNSVAMGFARPISRTDFPLVLEPRPIAKAITQHTLHRFVVNKAGTLGLSVTEKAGYVFVRAAAKDSHAEKLGVKIHDEICLPFTNGTSAKNICERCKFNCRVSSYFTVLTMTPSFRQNVSSRSSKKANDL
jgi:hypothetical protein